MAEAVVLDSSALLAYLRRETGDDVVRGALKSGAAIGAANWAETLTKLSDLGADPDEEAQRLADQGILGNALMVYPVTEATAQAIARLRPLTKAAGLSLGDRACLALAMELGLPVLTADRLWESVPVAVTVRVIR